MIFEKIRDLLASQLGIDPNTITENTNIISDLGADSIDLVDMLLSLESDLDIKFDDTDTSVIHTIKDVVNVVENLMKNK